MTGYRNRPEENAAALVEGWLRTGDVGVLDEDGYLSIVDRKKDSAALQGVQRVPAQAGGVLHQQPGVAGAAVVGRPTRGRELPVAFVVARRCPRSPGPR
jgi:long-chain acyl-CoA synthetase